MYFKWKSLYIFDRISLISYQNENSSKYISRENPIILFPIYFYFSNIAPLVSKVEKCAAHQATDKNTALAHVMLYT